MFPLLLHIILSTGFGLIVKDSQVRGQNLWAVGAINYTTAAIASWISLQQVTMPESQPNLYQFSQPTLILGGLAGVGYVVSYFLLVHTGRSPWTDTVGGCLSTR